MVVAAEIARPCDQMPSRPLWKGQVEVDLAIDVKIEGHNFEQPLYLRSMQADDYAEVLRIMPAVSRCYNELSEPIVAKMLRLQTFFPFLIVRRNDAKDALVGYLELHRLPHFGRGWDGRLEKVLVLPDYRGLKIAQAACAKVIELARSTFCCSRLDLTVEKPDAMSVYRKLGFSPVDTSVLRLNFL